MEELEVIVSQDIGSIEVNFEEIKRYLTDINKEYCGAVFAEEDLKFAKQVNANLRKVKTGLETKRKEIKKKCLEPYEEFEQRYEEILPLIDQPINMIDGQVKDFEERKKEERRVKIRDMYHEAVGELEEFLPIEKIYDKKWENVSTSISSIKKDIEAVIESAKNSIETIKSMNSEAEEEAFNVFKQSLSLSDSITYIQKYEQQRAEIIRREEERKKREEEERIRQEEIRKKTEEEQARREEEERIRREEREKVLMEQKLSEAAIEIEEEQKAIALEQAQQEEIDELPFVVPGLNEHIYKVIASEEELELLETYMNSVGICFDRKE